MFEGEETLKGSVEELGAGLGLAAAQGVGGAKLQGLPGLTAGIWASPRRQCSGEDQGFKAEEGRYVQIWGYKDGSGIP